MESLYLSQIESLFAPILERQLVDEMIAIGRIETYEAGDIVIDINQKIERIPLMIEGSIKIMREDEEGNEMFLYYIEAGTTCAASLTCCMNSHRSNILAIVEEKATFLAIPVDYMDKWMANYRSWRSFILSNYATRYDELLEVIDLLAFKRMDDRVSNYIHEKAALHNSKIVIASHQEIAYDLNTSREVVSRILKQMERAGAVELKRGQIVLTDAN